MNLKEIEQKMEILKAEEKPYIDRKAESLGKKVIKKPEFVLVEYLRANGITDTRLCKVISGNIVVIDNKGHELNPKDTWLSSNGRFRKYIIREIDTKPVSNRPDSFLIKTRGVSNRDYNTVKNLHRHTENHPILIKMVLGAAQKKELEVNAKKWVVYVIIGAVIIGAIYLFTKGG